MQRFFANKSVAMSAACVARLVAANRLAVESFSGELEDFKQKVAKGATVVDCYTSWCSPCKQMAPFFTELSEKNAGVQFIKVDVEENEEVGMALNVRSIPLFVLFEDGKVTGTVEGANTQKLEELVKSAKK